MATLLDDLNAAAARTTLGARSDSMATGRTLGRVAGGAGPIEELTPIQAAANTAFGQTRVDIASAATVNLTTGVPDNAHINITGTTTITGFTVAVGRLLFVRFNAALTLTNNANIVTQSGANIATAAGDTCILRATAANVVEVLAYVPAILNQQAARSTVRVATANGYGSTNTVIRRFSTVLANQGADITYTDSATLGASFLINTPGTYAITSVDQFSAAANSGISVNSAQLTTDIASITAANRLVECGTGGANSRGCAAITAVLSAGDVVRPHTSGAAAGAVPNLTMFTITRVA